MKKKLTDRIRNLENNVSEANGMCPLYSDMIKNGWTLQNIEDFIEACNKAEAQLASAEFENLPIRNQLDLIIERSLDFIDTPSLRHKIKPTRQLDKLRVDTPRDKCGKAR